MRRPLPRTILAAAAVAALGAGEVHRAPDRLSEPAVIIESFTAGGREQTLRLSPARAADDFRGYEPVQLPVSAQALDFRIASNPATGRAAARIQYRLEGWDDDWQEVDGRMWLSLRFLDEAGHQISGVSLPRTGQSPGWTGDPNTSRFRISAETVTPPPRSRRLQFILTSGPPQATGIWLIKSLRVVAQPGGEQPERVILAERVESGDELQQRQGSPRYWRREGALISAPQVFTFATTPPTHALALADTDVSSSGRWVSIGRNVVTVEPGVPLRIEAEESFSIGGGAATTCSYHKLPAGRYTFRAIPVDEFGAPAGVGVRLPVVLVPPFYARWWFWTLIAVMAAGGLTGSVRYLTWKRMQRELERSESRRLVEQERMRIAQDIHDDMGARLTQISLVSSLALRNTPRASPLYDDLKRLDRSAREVAAALDEIVWAVNPAHDTLEGLGNYISQYVTEFVAGSSVRCRLDIPALLPTRMVSSRVRHHLLMAVKEALSNALKHSGSPEVCVQLGFADPKLTISISDRGRGFDCTAAGTGNGIENMKSRLAGIGGSCEIRSAPGEGTTVTVAVELVPGDSPA